jgi:hypothetical protein
VLAISMTVGAMLSTSPAQASAAGDVVTQDDYPSVTLMNAQNNLDAYAAQIETPMRITDRPGPGSLRSGFAGVKVDAVANTLTVYWRGSVPDYVNAVLKNARDVGITTSIVAARFDRETLEEVRAHLASGAASAAAMVQPTVISIPVDGSHLDVGVPTATAGSPSAASNATARFEQLAGGLVPVQLFDSEPTDLKGRWYDLPTPFYGGDEMARPDGSNYTACSGGFPVHNSAGTTYMTTAAHCVGTVGEQWYTAATTDVPMGKTAAVYGHNSSYAVDSAIVSESTAPRIWDGGVDQSGNGSGEFTKILAGYRNSVVGDWLCTSGGMSGAHCNGQVTKSDDYVNVGGSVGYVYAQRIEQPQHTVLAGQGDSGGPVFALANGNTEDIADSTISLGDQQTLTSCTGAATTCFWRIWAARISSTLVDSQTNISTTHGEVTSGVSRSLCIDDQHQGTTNGNPIQIYSCNNTVAQDWFRVGNTIQVLGGCLTAASGGTTAGTKLVWSTCNGSSAQQWSVSGTGENNIVKNMQSGLCVDDPKLSTTSGTQLQIWTCNGTVAQYWFVYGADGY